MTEEIAEQDQADGEEEESESESEALIDILSGEPIPPSAKNRSWASGQPLATRVTGKRSMAGKRSLWRASTSGSVGR